MRVGVHTGQVIDSKLWLYQRTRKDYDMNRRTFLIQAGLGAMGMGLTAARSVIANQARPAYAFDSVFPRYERFNPKVPVWCVTPRIDRCLHRFHSSSPFSPSGRYLGLTQIPFEDRPPRPGETANVVIVDLISGKHHVLARTHGWDVQLGAQVQWGASDEDLFFNDVDTKTWTPFGVRMNPLTGRQIRMEGTVYMVSPDGRWAASTCLRRIGRTQAGYGVVIPKKLIPRNKGASESDGVYVSDTESGKCRMIASYRQIVETATPKIDVARYGPGDFYGFHVKWNAQSNRIMLVLRYSCITSKRKAQVITMNRDGGEIHVAIPTSEWADKGGNHPTWHPDGEHVMMNLALYRKDRLYVQARYDGTQLKTMTDAIANHGHPTLHPDEKYILTDCYAKEKDAYGDGTIPLLWVDRKNNTKQALVRIEAITKPFQGKTLNPRVMRVDLHPAWDSRTYTHAAFNGVMDGTRNVFIADLRGPLSGKM